MGILVAQDQKVVFANRAISIVLGYSNEEITSNSTPFDYIHPVVKVLLTSGCDINGEALRVLSEGCDGFIQKPYSLEELSSKIKDIISIV